MRISETKRRRGWYRLETFQLVCMLLSLWAVLALHVSDFYGSLDDNAYIYLSYIENLYAGCGLRFHCSQTPVEGFWSPLYMIVLALTRWLFHDGEALLQWIGIASMVTIFTSAVFVLRNPRWHRQNHLSRILATMSLVVLFLYDHFLQLHMVSGTETALTCLVIGGLLYTAQKPSQPSMSYWLLAACLVRPEGFIFCLLAPRFFPQARTRVFWQPIGVGLALLVLFRLWWFGSIFPNLFWTSSGGTTSHLWLGLQSLLQVAKHFPWIILAPFALLLPNMRKFVQYTLVCSGIWFGSYLLTGGDPSSTSRLALPIIVPLTVLGLVGAFALLEECETAFPLWGHRLLPWVVPGLILLMVPFFWAEHTLPQKQATKIIQQQKLLASYLASIYPKQTIATSTPGIINYASGLRTLDLTGATSKELKDTGRPLSMNLLRREDLGRERIHLAWILSQKPKLIMFAPSKKEVKKIADLKPTMYIEKQLLKLMQQKKIPYIWIRAELSPKNYHFLLLRTKGVHRR